MKLVGEAEAWHTEPYVEGYPKKNPEQWKCLVCKTKTMDLKALSRHCRGTMHNKKLKLLLQDPYLQRVPNPAKNEDEWRCLSCQTILMSKGSLKEHCEGAQHVKNLRSLLEAHFAEEIAKRKNLQWLEEPYIHGYLNEKTEVEQWTCLLCQEGGMNLSDLASHCRGTGHFGNLKALEDSYLEIHSNHWKCLVCREAVSMEGIAEHCKGSRHRKKFHNILVSTFNPTNGDKIREHKEIGMILAPKLEGCRTLQERIAALDDPVQQWHVSHLLMQDVLEDEGNFQRLAEATRVLEEYESSQAQKTIIQRMLTKLTGSREYLCLPRTIIETPTPERQVLDETPHSEDANPEPKLLSQRLCIIRDSICSLHQIDKPQVSVPAAMDDVPLTSSVPRKGGKEKLTEVDEKTTVEEAVVVTEVQPAADPQPLEEEVREGATPHQEESSWTETASEETGLSETDRSGGSLKLDQIDELMKDDDGIDADEEEGTSGEETSQGEETSRDGTEIVNYDGTKQRRIVRSNADFQMGCFWGF